MSLKGSLQTAALPEVLKFLAETGKSGELHVRGSHIEGRLWFSSGALSGHEVVRSADAVEALFQLLRNDEGDFGFSNSDGHPEGDHSTDRTDVAEALEHAQARLAEWSDIVAVVPSLDHRLTLATEAPADSIVVDSDQWAMVVAIGEGRTVAQTIDARHLGEFDGCRSVKVLVETGLVRIAEPDRPYFAPTSAEPLDVESEHHVFPLKVQHVDVAAAVDSVVQHDEVTEADLYDGFDSPTEDETPAEPAINGGDHYAALRSMIVDVDRDLSETGAAYPTSHHTGIDEVPEESMDGKSALQALLAEVSSYPVDASTSDTGPGVTADDPTNAGHGTVVDGLADRGPWPEQELASFEGWTEPEASAEHEAQVEEEQDSSEEAPGEEPINRGLLLKFLSSVRN